MKDYFVGNYRNVCNYVEKMYKGGLEVMPPAIITCAITGGVQGAEANPNLPEPIDAQVQSAVDAYNAGAAMVHIHVRNPERLGDNSYNVELFQEVNRRIRERCPDLIINNTCMGGRWGDADGKLGGLTVSSLAACPEVASIDLVNIYDRLFLKKREAPLSGRDEDMMRLIHYSISHKDALEVLNEFQKYDIVPEYEIFGFEGIKMLRNLVKARKDNIPRPYWCSLLFGGSGMLPSITSMIEAAQLLPEESMLNIIGCGATQIPIITAGLLLGHNVRVGMEDNVFYSKGRLLKSNAEMVERTVRIAEEIGRSIASPSQAREMMGLGAPRQFA